MYFERGTNVQHIHRQPKVVMVLTSPSQVAPEVVIMTTYGAVSDDKIGIMAILSPLVAPDVVLTCHPPVLSVTTTKLAPWGLILVYIHIVYMTSAEHLIEYPVFRWKILAPDRMGNILHTACSISFFHFFVFWFKSNWNLSPGSING